MIKTGNIFKYLPRREGRPVEHIEEILSNGNVKIERIVSYGKFTPEGEWYDDPRNEFVIIFQGGAELLFEKGNQRRKMIKGDWEVIPPHSRHRVERIPGKKNTDTIWLTVYY